LEQEVLAEALAGAREGEGAVVFVDGAPGLGSSGPLARGGGRAGGGGGAEPDEAARMLAGGARLAGPLLSPGPRAALPDDGEAFSVFHGLYWLCNNLSAATPLALLVDDVPWSDLASRPSLVSLARRVAALPICVVVSAD